MPIRFRCAYCHQLMGISRRKAGQVIRCPKCAGQVIVPTPPDQQPAPSPVGPGPAASPPGPALFEGSDFDKIFGAPTTPASPPPPAAPFPLPAASGPQPTAGSYDVEPLPGPLAGPGIFLTPGKLTFVSVFIVLLLGVAFLLGLLIGRSG